MKQPTLFSDPDACAAALIERLDGRVVMGMPLGLGKPVPFANAIYQQAAARPEIRLEIFTALSLQPPPVAPGLAGRFLAPLLERVFDRVPLLDYVRDRRGDKLPGNVQVTEFYFAPGSQLHQASAQQEYCSVNYTHVTRTLLDRKVNLLAAMVAVDESGDQPRYSLSCNPDLTLDLAAARARGEPILVLGQVNRALPFMPNDAEVAPGFFDYLLDAEALEHPLFPALNRPVSLADYATGLHVASLVPDAGTLQIGIGSLGDAVVNALVQRQHHGAAFGRLIEALVDDPRQALRERLPTETGPFRRGLYGASEMLVHGFAGLRDAGILHRRVHDDPSVQQAINSNDADPKFSVPLLEALLDSGALASPLGEPCLARLKAWGILPDGAALDGDTVRLPGAVTLPAVLDSRSARADWVAVCGERPLEGGFWLEAGFFLGPNGLYRWLRGLGEKERAGINMTSVAKVNQLYGDEALRRLQRRNARFINEAMMVTLSGAVVSDGLDSGQVVSGVGGQFNFVAMAQELEGARSIIVLPATRSSGGRVSSNIVWNYAHTTIPRHLRDIVVTEYGAADLRGASDRDVAVALIKIADSRFQEPLLAQARAAGKIEPGYALPEAYRHNTPDRVRALLLDTGEPSWFPHFPWGSDMTDTEAAIAVALAWLKREVSGFRSMMPLLRSLPRDEQARFQPALARMGLERPRSFRGRLERRLLLTAMARTQTDGRPLKPLSPKYGDRPGADPDNLAPPQTGKDNR